MKNEAPINSEQARMALGRRVPCACGAKPKCKKCGGSGTVVKPLSRSYMWALKKAMEQSLGKSVGRYFYLSEMQAYLKKNPGFSSKSQKGDKALIMDVIEFMKSPAPVWARRERRDELISKLEVMAA